MKVRVQKLLLDDVAMESFGELLKILWVSVFLPFGDVLVSISARQNVISRLYVDCGL